MYYNRVATLMTRQLALGQHAIIDRLITDEVGKQWAGGRGIARRGAGDRGVYMQRCRASPPSARRQAEGHSGWHEVGWDHVESMRIQYPPLTVAHMKVDSVGSVEDNIKLVLERL
jgi:hypothetical protein